MSTDDEVIDAVRKHVTHEALAFVAGDNDEMLDRLDQACGARHVEQAMSALAFLSVKCERLEREAAKLRAIVDRLPKTADGVPWVDDDEVFCPHGHSCRTSPDSMPWCDECVHEGIACPGMSYMVDQCFSTRAAALSASRKDGTDHA